MKAKSEFVKIDKMSISEILFSFKGRIPRHVFWFSLLGCIFFLIAEMVVIVLTNNNTLVESLFYIFSIPLIVSAFAIPVKRLHDLGKSGWWVIIPYVGLICGLFRGNIGTNKYGDDPLNRY